MPGLRELIKKRDRIDSERHRTDPSNPTTIANQNESSVKSPSVPEFTFVRTTTHTEELIEPPSFVGDTGTTNRPPPPPPKDGSSPTLRPSSSSARPGSSKGGKDVDTTTTTTTTNATGSKPRRLSNLFHKSSPPSKDPVAFGATTSSPPSSRPLTPTSPSKSEKRLSSRLNERLHISSRSRSTTATSENIPLDLPEITAPEASGNSNKEAQMEREAQWEKRATLLAQGNMRSRSRSVGSDGGGSDGRRRREEPSAASDGALVDPGFLVDGRPGAGHVRRVSDEQSDVTIQEAIRLHESGDLEASTLMFSRLASQTPSPSSATSSSENALAQILYALSLRHGWGCTPDPPLAVHHLTRAAYNSAQVESAALAAGSLSGGPAKGELVLSTFELGNVYRYGWGVKTDPLAARRYYETAAELGDVDALNEAAWCFLEGFGGGKDKFRAAGYLRRAESGGSSGVGNNWIWKEKYDPK